MVRAYAEYKRGMGTQSEARGEELTRLRSLCWCSLGAIIGLSGGVIAAFTGSLLTALAWFTNAGVGSSYARTLGTILLFITIPLLISGAHCLDLADKRKGKEKESRLHEN